MAEEDIEEALINLLDQIEAEFEFHYRRLSEYRNSLRQGIPGPIASMVIPPHREDSTDERSRRLLVLVDVANAERRLRRGFMAKGEAKEALLRLSESAKELYPPGGRSDSIRKALKKASKVLS
jgi:hypothetical protein